MSPFDTLYLDCLAAYRSGAMAEAFFRKCVVTIAAEHAKAARFSDALRLLAGCPAAYLRAELPPQAAADPFFAAAVRQLAAALVEAGHVSPDPADYDVLVAGPGRA